MKLYSIDTGYFKLDGGAMFGVVPKSIWTKLNPSDENNLCSWALRCLLIQDENRLILVDNGIGNKQDAKFFSHYYLHGDDTLDSSLAKHGFHRDDITDVISIMYDGDKLVPAFKNASYWSNERHWKWATVPNDREKASFLKENILPIKESGQLKLVPLPDWNTSEFTPNIDMRFVHGHTDAMMLPQIKYKDRVVVFMADLLPSVAHIPMPYIMAYDMFPLTTLQEKKIFLHEAVENNYILFFEHDRENECCEVQQTERGIRASRFFKVEEI
jgi:hypothetical protein